jgi:hypothetical protein
MALFKKHLKTTHPVLGDKIKSFIFSPAYADVFDGEHDVLSHTEKTNNVTFLDGQIPLGANYASSFAAFNFPILPSPHFGSADLYNIELNLFAKDSNYNKSHTLPDYEIYKLKKTLPDIGGKFLEIDTSNVLMGGGRFGIGETIEEHFVGTEDTTPANIMFPKIQSTGGKPPAEDLYMLLEDAWDVDKEARGMDGNDASNCGSQKEYKERYGNYSESVGWVVKFDSYKDKFNKIGPTKATYSWTDFKDDPVYKRTHWDKSFADETGNSSKLRKDVLKAMNEGTLHTADSTEEDAQAYERLIGKAKLDSDNTFFDGVYGSSTIYDPDGLKNADGTNAISAIATPFFSTAGGATSCAKFSCYTDAGWGLGARKGSFAFRDENQGYQTIMAYLRLPKHLSATRQYDTQTDIGNTVVEIKFQIESLPKYMKSVYPVKRSIIGGQLDVWDSSYYEEPPNSGDADVNIVGTDVDLAPTTTVANYQPYPTGNAMCRSIVFMCASRRPDKGETFGEYIHRLNSGYDRGELTYGVGGNDGENDTFIPLSIHIDQDRELDSPYYYHSGKYHPAQPFTAKGDVKINGHGIGKRNENNYNGIAFMRIPEYKRNEHITNAWDNGGYTDGRSPNNQSSDDGQIMLFHSGQQDFVDLDKHSRLSRTNFWDGWFQEGGASAETGHELDFVPYVSKRGMWGRCGVNFDGLVQGTMPNEHSYKRMGSGQTGTEFVTGEWYTLKIVFNNQQSGSAANLPSRANTLYPTGSYGESTISWFILDASNKIVASVLNQLHSGSVGNRASLIKWAEDVLADGRNRDGDTYTTRHPSALNTDSGFPFCLSIWVNNAPVGLSSNLSSSSYNRYVVGEVTGDHYFYKDDSQSSEVSLLMQHIKIDGHKISGKNASISPNNKKTNIEIDSTPVEDLIMYDKGLVLRDSEATALLYKEGRSKMSDLTGKFPNLQGTRDFTAENYLKGEPIPSRLEIEDSGGADVIIPSYITWGFRADRKTGTNNKYNNNVGEEVFMNFSSKELFMGGFSTAAPLNVDGNDPEKSSLFKKTGAHTDTDIYFFYPWEEQLLGQYLTSNRKPTVYMTEPVDDGALSLGVTTLNKDPYLNNAMTLDGENRIDRFTKKGFMRYNGVVAGQLMSPNLRTYAHSKIWYPRESPIFSAKITKIIDADSGLVEVDDLSLLDGFEDDEYIIYRAGKKVQETQWDAALDDENASPHIRRRIAIDRTYSHKDAIRIKLVKSHKNGQPVKWSDVGKRGTYDSSSADNYDSTRRSNPATMILQDSFLPELYISPLRYWLVSEIYNRSSSDKEVLPKKSYNHMLSCTGSMKAENAIAGASFTESLYSDTTVYSNKWDLSLEASNSMVVRDTDFGFGGKGKDDEITSFDSESAQGHINKFTPDNNTFNTVSLKGLVDTDSKTLTDTRGRVSLLLKASVESIGFGTLASTKYPVETKHPYLSFIWEDEVPTITGFSVEPDPDDSYFPKFEWEVSDNDLWYGFIIVDNNIITNQYHGAALHLPLDEKTSGQQFKAREGFGDDNVAFQSQESFDKGSLTKGYKYDTVNTGATISPSSCRHLIYSEEGLSGPALLFHGLVSGATSGEKAYEDLFGEQQYGRDDNILINQYLEFEIDDFTQPTTELSIVAHFTVRSLGDTLGGVGQQDSDSATLIDAHQRYKIWVDSSGFVNALLHFSAADKVTLKSTSTILPDDTTPSNVILTFDGNLLSGNVKLFLNGTLEDQSGKKLATGDSNHWQIGANVYNYNTAGSLHHLRIGARTSASSVVDQCFNGKIEEIVIYNRVIYPVNPENKEFTLYKPMKELSTGTTAVGKPITAKLIIKDYHNIRGTTAEEVASSSVITIAKGGLGLKTD